MSNSKEFQSQYLDWPPLANTQSSALDLTLLHGCWGPVFVIIVMLKSEAMLVLHDGSNSDSTLYRACCHWFSAQFFFVIFFFLFSFFKNGLLAATLPLRAYLMKQQIVDQTRV